MIGTRKLLLLKRGSRKYPGKQSVSYYLPIYDSEVRELALTEQSMVRAEIAKVEDRVGITRPAFEIQDQLDNLRESIKKILDGYDDETAIRKSVLMPKILKVLDTGPSISEQGSAAIAKKKLSSNQVPNREIEPVRNSRQQRHPLRK